MEYNTKPFRRWTLDPREIHRNVPPLTTLEGFFPRPFIRRIAEKNENRLGRDGLEMHGWERLVGISQEMQNIGRLDDSQGGILHHFDLEPRDIIVSCEDRLVSAGGQVWKIVGVTNWDDAISSSLILAHYPLA